MKTNFALAVLLAATCLGPRVARAQQPSLEGAPSVRPLLIGFGLGEEVSTGKFASYVKAAAIDFHVQMPLAPRRLSLRGDVLWMSYPSTCPGPEIELPPGQSNSFGCSVPDLITANADIVARLNDPSTRWSPYALAGAGVYFSQAKEHRPPMRGALQGGLGFEVRTGKTATLYTEYRYFGMGPGWLAPVTIGMRF